MVAYALQRGLFIGFNFSALQAVPASSMMLAILDGFRFDLCVIATLNVPLILLHQFRVFLPAKTFARWLDHLVWAMFLILNLPMIVIGVVDSRLFSFTGRRISPEFFSIIGDIKHQTLGILTQFWYLSLPGYLALILFSWATWQKNINNNPSTKFDPRTLRKNWPAATALLATAFLLIRGGWQTKPLAPAHAYNWQPAALANMVLNSGMTLLRTPASAKVSRLDFFPTMADVRANLTPAGPAIHTLPLANGKNFVVIVVESLATEYVGFLNHGKGYTPVLDALSTQAITFTTSFANGRRSIDAMPAIFAGIPAWRDEPFVTSPYASNEIQPAPKTLASLGYRSLFMHGASKGSMHFDSFSRMAGFDEYIGRSDYPKKGDDDGQWGIFDEPFLQFATDKFSAVHEPFFAGIFTLTSHNPFKIPEKYKDVFPKGTLPIHESIGYVDHAIGEFFKTAKTKPWFNHTIFIITGDHTSLSDNPAYNNMPGRFRVPIMFYDPSGSLPRVQSTKIASHIDITPSVLELAGAHVEHPGLFGGALFDPSWSGRFVQHEYGIWYYNDGVCQIVVEPNESTSFYDSKDYGWKAPMPGESISEGPARLTTLKAERQYFTNGLLDDSWFKN
jgi:phosphoglycerol transferase MdoB-like AlkP superfamily enzyme